MSESKRMSYLCIGGPLAGRRYEVQVSDRFSTPAFRFFAPALSNETTPDSSTTLEIVDYHEQVFHSPEGAVSFWVPFGQTPLQTIELLLEAYERGT
jgi:hypothetical protein